MANIYQNEVRNIPDIKEMLLASTGIYATCTAFHEKRDGIYQNISYGRFRDDVMALGTVLPAHLPKQARVLIIGKNSYAWALSFLTLLCGIALPIPVDMNLSASELAAVAAEADANAVLYAPEQAEKIASLPGMAAISFAALPQLIAAGRTLLTNGDVSFREREIDPQAPAALFYTSGTTARAKGVLFCHKNLASVLMQLRKMQTIEAVDTFLSILPLSHMYECVAGLLFPLYCGASVAFAEGVHALMRNMREVHPTCMVTIPYLAEALYRKFWKIAEKKGNETQIRRAISVSDPVRPLAARQVLKERLLAEARAPFGGALRYMLVLGEFLDPAVQKGLRQIGIFAAQGYGITECAGLAAVGHTDRYRDGTAGLVLPDSVIDIYSPDEDGSGEIRYKGDNVMLGYYRNATLTDAVLRRGWYYTGDFGRIDADGFLHIIGRRQNCIEKANGKLISPEELEGMLKQSPFIKDAVVVGVLDDNGADYEPAALIYPDETYAADMYGIDFTREEMEGAIGDWVTEMNTELPVHKQITLFALRDTAFPRNEAGRILRAELAKELDMAKEHL